MSHLFAETIYTFQIHSLLTISIQVFINSPRHLSHDLASRRKNVMQSAMTLDDGPMTMVLMQMVFERKRMQSCETLFALGEHVKCSLGIIN